MVWRLWQKTRRPTNCERREEEAHPVGDRMRSLLGSRLFLSRELAVSQSERSFCRGTRPGRKQAFPLKVRRPSSSVCGKGSLCQLIPDSSKVWKTRLLVHISGKIVTIWVVISLYYFQQGRECFYLSQESFPFVQSCTSHSAILPDNTESGYDYR